jgi:transposase-like protein
MDVITTMPSIDFQRIARDMGNLATDMNIYRDGAFLELSCEGDFANQKTVLEFPDSIDKKIGSAYNLRYINMFTKATGLCSSVQLMQDSSDENMPIIFRYGIANLGDVKFYLAPRVDESLKISSTSLIMESRFNEKVREFQDIIKKAKGEEKKNIENEMYTYMAKTAPFIKEYHHGENIHKTKTNTVAGVMLNSRKGVQREDIFNSYLAQVEEDFDRSEVTFCSIPDPVCKGCGKSFTKLFDESLSEEICTDCGTTDYILGDEVGFKEEQEMEKNIIYSYKRENHFNEWVSQFQAKESTSVPPEVIEELRLEFKKQKVKDLSEITHEKGQGSARKSSGVPDSTNMFLI